MTCIVAERPPLPPILSGMQSEYQQGSILNVSCSSSPGLPAPDLTWTINGQKVGIFGSEGSLETAHVSKSVRVIIETENPLTNR